MLKLRFETALRLIAAGLLVFVLCSPALAQSAVRAPDVSTARMRIGHVYLNPAVALTNLGIDTNVFNEPDQSEPKHDFTLTLAPQTDIWLRMGHTWLLGNVREDLVWYRTFASERSANTSLKVGWLAPLNRLTFSSEAAYLRARDRPGFEIDARSERSELSYRGSVEIRVRPKVFVGIRGDRRRTSFDSVAIFEGVSLREALNRTVTSEGLTVRHQLTPLTAVTLDLGRTRERFEFSPLRDANSTSVTLGAKFDPYAVVKGSATFGFRDFQPLSPGLPAYTGTTATADLAYVAFGRTRFGAQAIRDIQYSFEIAQPYYLLTGLSGSVAQQIAGPVSAIARLGRQRLIYQDRIGENVAARGRIDYVHTYGGGIEYRLGRAVRIGFNVDRQHRSSLVLDRDYHGFRFGTSVTYGL